MNKFKKTKATSGMVSTMPERRKVMFTFVGTLDYRGRLQKEVATLQRAGHECRLLLGNIGEREVVSERYGFPIEEIMVPCFKGKVRYFIAQLWFAWWAGRLIARSTADTVVCVALDSVLAGVVAKWCRPSLRLVFDSNELHLESYNSRIKKLIWKPLQAIAIRFSDAILHAEHNRMAYFLKVYGGKSKPQDVIENFPHYHSKVSRPDHGNGPVKVIYLGALGNDRYTHELIDAGRSMEQSIELDFVGFATPEVMEQLNRRYGKQPAPNVRILPPVAYNEIPRLLEDYHIGIALYKNTNLNNYYCAPNKVYDYLMSGMAVIANDYPGLHRVLEEQRLGACVSEVTPESIAKAVQKIVSEKRWSNITDEIRQRYSWESQEPRLIATVAGQV